MTEEILADLPEVKQIISQRLQRFIADRIKTPPHHVSLYRDRCKFHDHGDGTERCDEAENGQVVPKGVSGDERKRLGWHDRQKCLQPDGDYDDCEELSLGEMLSRAGEAAQ